MRASFPAVLAFVALLLAQGCAHTRPPADETSALRKAMARHAVRQGQWAAAMDLLSELYRASPRDAEVLALRGVALREQGLLHEAETELLEAVRLAPDYAWGQAQLAVLLDLLEKPDQALVHHRRAVALEPENPGWLNNLAFSQFARGQTAEAIEGYRHAVRLAPNDARIRNNLGFALARSGDFRAAAEQFRHAGGAADARINLGLAYEIAGNLAQAFDLYLEAARLDPGSTKARSNLEHVAQRLGRAVPQTAALETTGAEGRQGP
ncbi:MAG: tetratricopeptide repeat protein [Myxococcales bacterium]